MIGILISSCISEIFDLNDGHSLSFLSYKRLHKARVIRIFIGITFASNLGPRSNFNIGSRQYMARVIYARDTHANSTHANGTHASSATFRSSLGDASLLPSSSNIYLGVYYQLN